MEPNEAVEAVLVDLAVHAREHVDVVAPARERVRHRVNVRSDPAAARFRRILPRQEEDAESS